MELFIVKIDYKNLTGFLTTKKLNYRQVRWAEILIEYYFKIEYIKGIDNGSKFNLPSDLVPLMGPRRLIPMVKPQYTLRKPHFWVNKKPPRET
jgi:hypothetical protein